MNKNESMVFKDNNNNEIILTNFESNIHLLDDKILVLKYNYTASPKKNNILMITEREEADNKMGVGKVIALSNNIKNIEVNSYILFNKWNNCLEFNHQGNTYFVVKMTEVHAKLLM